MSFGIVLSCQLIDAECPQDFFGQRYTRRPVKADGACLFRAVAKAMWNDEELYKQVVKDMIA